MKKLVVLFCLGMIVVGMTACGNKEENANQSTEQTVATETQTGSEMSSDNATQVATNETLSEETEGVATESIETEGAMEETTEYIDVTAGWSEEMDKIKQAVVSAMGENYWPNTPIFPEMLETMYEVTPDMYDDYMGEMPMISTNVDTLLIIKAKEEQVDAVVDALNAYRQRMIADTMQYPMNVGKIQASRVQALGNYVCFVQLGGDTTVALESGDDAVIQQCMEQNDIAIGAITDNLPQ